MYGTANYGREVLLNPNQHYTGGLAMPDINARGGVFGPQGYGGGIFDGSMMGLGQTTTVDVRAWQGLLNVELRERGMNLLPVTGVLDGATCGATLYLVTAYNEGESIYGALVDAFKAGMGAAIAAECAAIPQPWPPPKKRFGTMQILMYGGLGAVAFLILGSALKKKKR